VWRVIPDVLPYLDRLTTHTLGIISNGDTAQQQKLEVLGIAAQFAVMVTSETVGVAKPDSRIFSHAC